MSLRALIGHRSSAWAGTLAHLSLTHCPPRAPVPTPPDNRQRYQAFRRAWLPPVHNSLPPDDLAETTHRASSPAPAHEGA